MAGFTKCKIICLKDRTGMSYNIKDVALVILQGFCKLMYRLSVRGRMAAVPGRWTHNDRVG